MPIISLSERSVPPEDTNVDVKVQHDLLLLYFDFPQGILTGQGDFTSTVQSFLPVSQCTHSALRCCPPASRAATAPVCGAPPGCSCDPRCPSLSAADLGAGSDSPAGSAHLHTTRGQKVKNIHVSSVGVSIFICSTFKLQTSR